MARSKSESVPQLSQLKVVIRCHSFAESRAFYAGVLALEVLEEWDEVGGMGCAFALSPDGGGLLEIYQMATDNPRYDPAFDLPAPSDKIDIQLRTESLDTWVEALAGRWAFSGPERLPWGHCWIRLRDPDNVLIAIYEDATA